MKIVQVIDYFVHPCLITSEQLAAETETIVQAECLSEIRKFFFSNRSLRNNPGRSAGITLPDVSTAGVSGSSTGIGSGPPVILVLQEAPV